MTGPPASSAEILTALAEAERRGPPVVACTVLTVPDDPPEGCPPVGSRLLVRADGSTLGSLGGGPLEQAVIDAARDGVRHHLTGTYPFTAGGQRLRGRREAQAVSDLVEILFETVEPTATLLVVGGGHVGFAIAEMGALLGMSVAVIDDREDFANAERFPFADHVICDDVERALDAFPVTPGTYAVLVTRGHKLDELSLRRLVERDIGYLGMIGSKRRTGTVLRHLAEEGVSSEALERVFTPIGLDIGAETPEEIAVSVLAEIILVQRGGTAQPLSEAGRHRAAAARGR